MAKRDALGKKLRFEIFKRDSFTCGYCGKTPPDAILEVDHIKPVSKGGTDDMNNLITSCFDCNRGKRNIELKQVPPTLNENLEIIKEKEDQYNEYQKLLKRINSRINREIEKVNIRYTEFYDGWEFSESFKAGTVKMFIKKLGFNEVMDAIDITGSKIKDCRHATKYFCGVCWSKVRNKDNG